MEVFMTGHIKMRQVRSGSEVFFGPCTDDEAEKWLRRNRFVVVIRANSDTIEGDRPATDPFGTSYQATFRVFTAEELTSHITVPLPSSF